MAYKIWNWLHKEWPQFTYDKEVLGELEFIFSQNTGTALGVLKHIQKEPLNQYHKKQ